MLKGNFTSILNSKTITILFIAVNLFTVILVYANLNDTSKLTYTSSDALYAESIYRDVIIDNSGIQGWFFNGAPNFFPDLMMYFIIRSVFHNFLLAYLVYSIFQIAFLLLLSFNILKEIIPVEKRLYLNVSLVLMLLFCFSYLIDYNRWYTFLYLSISYHMGSYILFLLSFYLLLKYLTNHNKRFYIIILTGIIFLGVFNDRLFLFQFSLPSLILLIFIFKNAYRKKLLVFYLIQLVAVTCAILLYNFINNTHYISIDKLNNTYFAWSGIPESLNNLISNYLKMTFSFSINSLINVLFFCSFLFMLVRVIKNLKRIIANVEIVSTQEWKEFIYVILTLAYSIFIFLAPALVGNYRNYSQDRYNIFFQYFNVFNLGYVLYRISKSKNFDGIMKAIAGVIIILNLGTLSYLALRTNIVSGLKEYIHYYPVQVRYIDELSEEYGFQYGISEYWLAKRLTLFSRNHLRVYQVYGSLTPRKRATNENWYYGRTKGNHMNPAFTFIITNLLKDTSIKDKFRDHILDTLEYTPEETLILLTDTFKYNRETNEIYFPHSDN